MSLPTQPDGDATANVGSGLGAPPKGPGSSWCASAAKAWSEIKRAPTLENCTLENCTVENCTVSGRLDRFGIGLPDLRISFATPQLLLRKLEVVEIALAVFRLRSLVHQMQVAEAKIVGQELSENSERRISVSPTVFGSPANKLGALNTFF